MVLCALLTSTSFTVGKAIATGLDPAVLTFIRFVIATIILLPYVKIRHGLRASWSTIRNCVVISLFLVVFFWCMFLSLRYTTALNTSIIFTLVPSIAGFYAIFLVGERLTIDKIIALVCGMAGAVWVIFHGDINQLLAMQWNRGDIIFQAGISIISSMGAALRTDPTKIQYGDIFESRNCPLAKHVRKRLRRRNIEGGISCVFSTEKVDFEYQPPEQEDNATPYASRGRQRNVLGSLPTLTGIFGLYIANQAILQLTRHPS